MSEVMNVGVMNVGQSFQSMSEPMMSKLSPPINLIPEYFDSRIFRFQNILIPEYFDSRIFYVKVDSSQCLSQ